MASYNLNLRGGVGVFALLAASAVATLEARTVAWYHFDEVEPGTRLVASDRALNAVDSSKLPGTPYSVGTPGAANYTKLGSNANFMPMATNNVADTVYVVDPVGGTTTRNERSLYFTYADDTANNRPARYGGCVQIASDSSLSLSDVTVEFFVLPVRMTSMSNNGYQLVAKQSTGTSVFSYSICLESNGNPYVNCYDSTGTLMSMTGAGKLGSDRSVMDGRWHHIAFTASGTTAKLYVDHVLRKTVELTESLHYKDDAPLYIGATQMSYYKPGGFIDEVRISDEALEPQQFLRYLDTVSTHFHADFEGNLQASTPAIAPYITGTGGKRNKNEGANPTFSTEELPGLHIVDGLGNTLRETNACSLRFVGSTVTYPSNPDLEMPEMTVEFFMKYQAASNWAGLVRFNQATNNWTTTPIWFIGFSGNGSELIMRVDTTEKTNQGQSFGSSFLDGKWHHVGVTFQQGATSITIRLYDNYRQVGTDWSINGRLDYSKGSCLGLGTTSVSGSAFTGWLDEVRISRGVLPVEEFMRAEGKRQIMIIFR